MHNRQQCRCRTVHTYGQEGAAWLAAGFDNIEPQIGYDNNVLNKYFNEYLPRAVCVPAAQLPNAACIPAIHQQSFWHPACLTAGLIVQDDLPAVGLQAGP